MNELGGLLRQWRKTAAMTQVSACAALGYSSSGTVSLHETGDAVPSASAVLRYAEVYGRSREDLVEALLLLAGGEGGIGPSIPGQDEAPRAEVASP